MAREGRGGVVVKGLPLWSPCANPRCLSFAPPGEVCRSCRRGRGDLEHFDKNPAYAPALADIRRRGYVPQLVCLAPYSGAKTGDLVAALRYWNGTWRVDEISRIHSFRNMAFDFKMVSACLDSGHGAGCPLVVLERSELGQAPDTTRHMPSFGYQYELGVAQTTYMYRCADSTCPCQFHANARFSLGNSIRARS